MENVPHTSECTSSNDFIVGLVLTSMSFSECLAWMHAVLIESSFVYPSITDRKAVALMWAGRCCHSRDSGIVRGFQVVFGSTVRGVL
jgi:hypothetical protein